MNRLKEVTGGAAAAPLLVLFGLNLVDEFDRVAFGVLTPEIRDAFGLSDRGVVAVSAVAAVTALCAALPLGWLADRTNRVRLSGIAALVWGGMAVVTGLAPTLAILVVARIGAGIGRITNEPVHASLLTDLYPPATHPRVFAFHRLANPLGLASALLAGLLADWFGWRFVFFAVAIPTLLLVGTLRLVKEPVRGASSADRETAEEAAAAEPVPFGEARRQLFAVRSLRRLWAAIFLLGIGALTLPQLISLFFEQEFGFGPQGRGLATFMSGVGVVIGLGVGQHVARRSLTAGKPAELARHYGWSFVVLGTGLALMAVSPWAWLALTFNLLAGIGLGAYQPNYFPLVGLVSPARVRSQAFAWAILWLGLGGLLSPTIADIGESDAGYRVAIVVLSAALVLGGVVARAAYGSVDRDIEQAQANLATAAALRRTMAERGEQALLVCNGVDVAYDGVQVLFGVDLEVQRGECVALLGTNGAGKSTLLKAISGLVDPVGGSIFFAGRDITHADAVATTKQGIVQMPGGKGCFPTLTVAEHFDAAAWLYAREPERVKAATEQVLEHFPRLRERWGSLAGDLSGGEQQQLALGMAFVAKPTLLLIDELSLGLAPTVVEKLLEVVREIHASGTTVIVVEQSVNVALTLAERAVFLEKGEVRFSGPTAELLERTDVLRAVYLQGAAAGLGASVEEVAAKPDVDRLGAPVMEVRGLRRTYGGIVAVDDVSFDLWPGEVLGFIGPNGAGKTTVFDLVCGFTPAERGTVRFGGQDVSGWSADRRALAGLGRSFQDARIFPALSVAENLALSLERHLAVRDHLCSALGLPAAREVEDDVAYTVDDLVELMGLGAFRDKLAGELSTGSRRIVDLAMALAHDPTVLVLDEPSSGIAQKEAEALAPLLLRLREQTGCALLVVEHDMPLITSISDRLVALEQGRVITTGPPGEVVTDPRVVESYLGGDAAALNRSGAPVAAGR